MTDLSSDAVMIAGECVQMERHSGHCRPTVRWQVQHQVRGTTPTDDTAGSRRQPR